MTRRLVVTADDLGRDPATTDVILGLLAESAVTATTLIPVSPHAADAGARARALGAQPRVHLTLTSERGLPPWRALTGTSSLTDGEGRLTENPFLLGVRGASDDVVAELDAQLAWMGAHDLTPAGADSHAGTLYGLHGQSWLAETLEWCARNRQAFRLPRDLEPFLGFVPPGLGGPHARAVELADELGVPLPAAMITNRAGTDDLGSYDDLRAGMIARLDTLPEGVSELFLHPSTEEAALDSPVRAWEAGLVRDPVWYRALDAAGIELVDRWWA